MQNRLPVFDSILLERPVTKDISDLQHLFKRSVGTQDKSGNYFTRLQDTVLYSCTFQECLNVFGMVDITEEAL